MFAVTLKMFGRGNAPRTIKGFENQTDAENYASFVLARYENTLRDTRRIKCVAVIDERGRALISWSYPRDYEKQWFFHAFRDEDLLDSTLEAW